MTGHPPGSTECPLRTFTHTASKGMVKVCCHDSWNLDLGDLSVWPLSFFCPAPPLPSHFPCTRGNQHLSSLGHLCEVLTLGAGFSMVLGTKGNAANTSLLLALSPQERHHQTQPQTSHSARWLSPTVVTISISGIELNWSCSDIKGKLAHSSNPDTWTISTGNPKSGRLGLEC